MTFTFTDWLASTFGTAAILAALVGAFWKIILNRITESVRHGYAKELETHKQELQHTSELALKEIEHRSAERNIKLTAIFQKQAEVIAETYAKLLPVLDTAEDFTMLLKEDDKQKMVDEIQAFNQKVKVFFQYYRPNKIYLPRPTSIQVNELLNTIGRLVGYHYRSETLSSIQPLTGAGQDALNRMIEKGDELRGKISPLLLALEDDFQKVLGFPMADKT